MRTGWATLALLGLAAAVGPVRAADEPAKKQAPAAAEHAGQRSAYLGLAVESLPAVVSSQMPGVIPKGEGLLVVQVAKDSPAAKEGFQTNDILLSYRDTKLSSPEQLVKLVHGDKPGQKVALHFIRGGKTESRDVTLGERESPPEQPKSHVFRLRPEERLREAIEESESISDNGAWESFDAMKLTRVDNTHWRAEIEYRDKDGKKEHKSFEGTREQLRKDIRAEKDLPANERGHLLRAINAHEPIFEFHFPPLDKIGEEFWQQP